ncbi:ParB family protein [Salmonella enterica]|nr:ParB family protein [Salmonella enterica]EJB0472615.1 ParB family protein [Salmonella enterica]EJC1143035.1 ParB family protein [Salmonella enterica]EJC1509957.1 ParB family protein [Salmonella enterica]EJC3420726.1 ParB family protein [Salmonella enterica]
MAKAPLLNLGDALLQGAKEPSSAPAVPIMPTSEMPMVLTLDEMAPNPDNPRTTRNPKYDEIKESIRARGLDTVPKMTKNPDIPGSPYIFSDGGNTRYAILRELYEETRDEHFYRFHVLFKPWPGRLKCLLGHLAENDVRGDLTFIDRALGVRKARTIHEETLGRVVTLRELSDLLKLEGYPIHYSMISRMEHTVEFLYPYMPGLLTSGLGKHQIETLLNLRADALNLWQQYSVMTETDSDFNEVFGQVSALFDDPELYSFDMFRDEFIGMLVNALPHPSLNYDRWLLELDPKARNQRMLFGEPEPVAPHLVDADRQAWQNASASLSGAENDDNQQINTSSDSTLISTSKNGAVLPLQPDSDNDGDGTGGGVGSSESPRPPKTEVQNDFLGGPSVISGDIPPGESPFIPDAGNIAVMASSFAGAQALLTADSSFDGDNDAVGEASDIPLLPAEPSLSSVAFANTGLEPVNDIWAISALQDDIDHLQDMAYRLVFELAEAMGCEMDVSEDKSAGAAGFAVSEHGGEFSLFLAGLSGRLPNRQFNMFMFCLNFFGSQSAGDAPVFDDVHVVKTLRLIRVIRRLRELQRDMPAEQNDGGMYEH